MEYELLWDSNLAKSTSGSGYSGVRDWSYFASKAHEQHGIEMYPEASYNVDEGEVIP